MKVAKVWYRIADYIRDEKNLDDVLKILSARVKVSPEEYEPFLKGTYILTLEEVLKHWGESDDLTTIIGSSKKVDAFNVKFSVYDKPQDLGKYLDPSITLELAKAKGLKP